MLQLLSPDAARGPLVDLIASLEADGVISEDRDGIMFGCLVARAAGGQTCTVHAFSGALHGSYIHKGFVPPCFSAHEAEDIIGEYDSLIHCYSDRIERGEEGLEPMRSALSNECLARLRALYTFHTPIGTVKLDEMGLAGIPTGTGDCATIKLISYCFRRGWEPLSLCEIYYGHGSTRYSHMQMCTPCDEKCAPILPHILRIPMIYSDDEIIVVDKPEGMLSVPGRGEDKQDCATKRARDIFPSIPQNPSVHRLDMDTSGILVMAKTDDAKRGISRQFEQRTTKKTYIALVEGVVRQDEDPFPENRSGDRGWAARHSHPLHPPYRTDPPDKSACGLRTWTSCGGGQAVRHAQARPEAMPSCRKSGVHPPRNRTESQLLVTLPILGARSSRRAPRQQPSVQWRSPLCAGG